jgi:heptose II phosphotransferase
MITKGEYKKYEIYYPSSIKNGETLGKKIVDREYEVLEIYKDSERNYVAKVKVQGDEYVLKSPKAEIVIPQRKIQTLFKKGESLTTLLNLERHRENGLDRFIVPEVVVLKRDKFLKESYILMPFVNGEKLSTLKDIDEVVEITKELHNRGIYHGDLNTSNFIKTSEGIKIIDTQGKEEKFWNFKRSYDILTLKRDKLVEMLNYDVEKKYSLNKNSLGYVCAFLLKEFKYTPFMQKIREIKRELRKRGWKI